MTWVNFRTLREKLDFAAVLKHYNVELEACEGNQLQGACPLPTHPKDRSSPSFSANTESGLWQCLDAACKAKGNAFDLCIRMMGLNPANGRDAREAALKVQAIFGIGTEAPAQPLWTPDARGSSLPARPPIVNAPLEFELNDLDPAHPYLAARGFTPETIQEFGLGYCSRGFFKERIAIPLHDANARLVGYCGRLVDDSRIRRDNPKYKFPTPRLLNDEVHELHRSLFLYNGHRISKPVSDLLVVQGFSGVWWLHQSGFPNVVALMANSCSPEQAALIVASVTPDGRISLMTDGNDAGWRCAASVLPKVASERLVRWIRLPKDKQPTDLSKDDLAAVLPAPSAPAKKKRAKKSTATDPLPFTDVATSSPG